MAKTAKKQLRALWLQVHKWIGLTLALLIIPISLTGAALVWHDWLDAQLEPQRHQSIAPAGLPASAYADAARAILSSEERITTIRFEGDKPVMVVASKPAKGERARPERTEEHTLAVVTHNCSDACIEHHATRRRQTCDPAFQQAVMARRSSGWFA